MGISTISRKMGDCVQFIIVIIIIIIIVVVVVVVAIIIEAGYTRFTSERLQICCVSFCFITQLLFSFFFFTFHSFDEV